MKGITKIIEKYKDNLTKKEKEYLITQVISMASLKFTNLS